MRLERLEQLSTGRVKLTFSDGSTLKTQPYVLAETGIFPGQEIDEREFAAFQEAVSAASAKERAVRIVSATGISEKELQKRLTQRGERPDQAKNAVDWLKDLHLLNDAETARQLVLGAARKGYGAARIKNILYEKGIPKEYWEEALSFLPEMDDAIDTFLHRHLDGKELDKKLLDKTVQALLRRGHSWKDIQAGLSRYKEDFTLENWNENNLEEPE